MPPSTAAAAFVRLIVLALLLMGCDGSRPSLPAEARTDGASGGELRIVSLSPAISRTLVDLGLEERIVGRSRYCDFLSADVAVVGDLYSIDYETLIRLAPTHVLVQPPASGVDAALERLAGKEGWSLGRWRLDSIDDIEGLVLDMPRVVFPDDVAAESALATKAAALVNEIAAALQPSDAARASGRTLVLAGVDPPLAIGPGGYLHEAMVRLGGRNALDIPGYPELSLEDIVRLDPDNILIVQPGGAEVDWRTAAGPVGELDIGAARRGRMAVLSEGGAMLPSTAIIDLAGPLREALEQFAAASP